MSVVSTKDISAGEEIYVCYNYKIEQAPEWYRNLWKLHCQAEHQSMVCFQIFSSVYVDTKNIFQKHG